MEKEIAITKATYVVGSTLELTFSDGVRAEIDFTPWIEKYPFFLPLRDAEYFQKFFLDGWTVAWPNGADIAPETLHKIAVNSLLPQSA